MDNHMNGDSTEAPASLTFTPTVYAPHRRHDVRLIRSVAHNHRGTRRCNCSQMGVASNASLQLRPEWDANATLDAMSNTQQQQLLQLDWWMNGILTNVVVCVGLITNVLTILVLAQRAMRSSTNVYLTGLAFWDSVVLVASGFLIGLPALLPDRDVYKTQIYAHVVAWIYPVALVAQTSTIYLTVSFTVERWIAVGYPLRAATMCTVKRAKMVTLGVSFAAALYNMCRWFDYRPRRVVIPSNETITIPDKTDLSKNVWYKQVYYSWLYLPIMCVIPVLVLSILNAFLLRAVRRSQRHRKEMNVKQSRENNITIMLVSVVVVFIVCQAPALVYNMWYALDSERVEMGFWSKALSTLRNFLVNLNSATNFWLYCALGQKFRRIFLHTFCQRCVHVHYTPVSDAGGTTRMSVMGASTRHHASLCRVKSGSTRSSNDSPARRHGNNSTAQRPLLNSGQNSA